LEESRYLYNKLLRECDFTALGKAAAYRGMTDTYWFQADWKSARHCYELALPEYQKKNDIYRILSAKCDIQLGESEPARRKLREINAAGLDREEYSDYAFQYAALALMSGDSEDEALAKSYLENLEPRWPYFREARDRYKIALLSKKGSKERAEASRLMRLFSGILRYVNISPGFFGVSVDLNKVIEDAIARSADKKAPPK